MTTRTSMTRWPLLGAIAVSFSSLCVAQTPASSRDSVTLAESKVHAFDIPASPLAQAAIRFSEQAGIQLLFDADLAKGLSANEVRGRLRVQDALLRLLGGTGLRWRYLNGTTITLEPTPAATGARVIGPVRVEGADRPATAGINGSTDPTATEGTRSYTSSALSIASKTPQSIKDTPQSVSVITQQRMQDQNLTDFASMMNQATGVSVVTTADPLTPTFYSRGFEIQRLQVDGGAPMNISRSRSQYSLVPQIDMAMYDHVEVLRGADGLFNGYGGPGGVINLTRKRALDHAQVIIESQAGSWSNFRAVIDATAPLGLDGKLRGRGVLAYQDQDYFYDIASSNKTLAYGVLEYDLFSATMLSAGLSSTRQDTVPFINGLPRYQSGADLKLPRDTCLCFPWNRHEMDTNEVFAALEQSFGEEWSLDLKLTHTKQERSPKYGYVYGAVNPLTQAGPIMVNGMSAGGSEQQAADLTLEGGFQLFGHRQLLVVGANYAKVDGAGYKEYTAMGTGNPAVDVADFDPNDPAYAEPAAGLPTAQRLEDGTTQWGAYATLRLTFWEPLHLNLGLRYSHFELGNVEQRLCSNLAGCVFRGAPYATGEVMSTSTYSYGTDDLSWPPTWSLVYDLSNSLSVYGSYTDIYEEQATLIDRYGNSIDPLTGSNIEAGIKWSGRDGQLNATLAIYQLKQENFGIRLAGDGGWWPDGIHVCCYSNEADVTFLSQGADLEINGELLPGWQLAAGYTYNKNEYRGSDLYRVSGDAKVGMPLVSQAPEHLFKLWSSYQLQRGDWLRRLSIGGGLNAQTKAYYAGSACVAYTTDMNGNSVCDYDNGGSVPYQFTQGFYAVFAARVGYRIDSRWNASLNINNIADRTYYQTPGSSDGGNWYGEPRNFMLTLRGAF